MSVPKEKKSLVRNEIPNEKFQLLSDFKTNFLQRVRFQINFFTTRQILEQIFHNMSDLKSKNSQRVRFCLKKLFKNQFLHKKVLSKNLVLTEFTPLNGRILQFLCILISTILTQKICLKSRFLTKKLQRVRF